MSYSSKEIYREKYLKYKKKYMSMLENMKGGYNNQPITDKATIYFCTEETYRRLQLARKDKLHTSFFGEDNCFIERFNRPSPSLMLCNFLGNYTLKTTDGKNVIKKPNYKFLYGREFGIVEEAEVLPKIGVKKLPFNSEYALKQLQDAQPILLDYLKELRENTTEIYYLHTYKNGNEKNVSYNGILEYYPLPTFNNYLRDPQLLTKPNILSNQIGGANFKFYFCNDGASRAIEMFYGIINDSNPIIVSECLNDIALDPIDGYTSIFAVVKQKEKKATIIKKLESEINETPNVDIDETLGENEVLNIDTEINNIKKIKTNLFPSLYVNDFASIFVYKLYGNKLTNYELELESKSLSK